MTNKKNDSNTGSTEVQVTILTERILLINNHLQTNKKDNSSRRGLLLLVSRRRRLLKYYQRKELDSYKKLIKKLNIRK